MTSQQLQGYYSEFDSLNKTITNRLNLIEITPSPKEANKIINEVNQLISSASLILAKIHEVDSNSTSLLKIKENYSQLELFRRRLSTLTTRIQLQLLSATEDNHMTKIPNQPIDVNLITDYNESLLHGTVSNLQNIHQNLAETSTNLKGQGDKITNTVKVMDQGSQNIKDNTSQLNSMNCSTKCQKLWMIIVNILLFSIIILLIMLKILNYLK